MTDQPDLLMPAEAADRLGLDPKSLIRYVERGWIGCQRTMGGHRRYFASEINAIRSGVHPSQARFAKPAGGA